MREEFISNNADLIFEENEINKEILLERKFQDLIYYNNEIKNSIAEILIEKSDSNYIFEKEVEFINGITADFVIFDESLEVLSTIECKRPDIGVTEYVRGIGQLFQYEYFFEKNISPKKYSQYLYNDENSFNTALIIPSDFYKNTKLNIGKFKYPTSTKIIEINEVTNNVREIDRKLLLELSNKENNTFAISSYYFRDNRLFEYYILLKYIQIYQVTHPNFEDSLNRREAEVFLRKIKTINNGNWRNAFITLSVLGFIDNNNFLTISGKKMVELSLEKFIYTIYSGYIFPYVDVLMKIFKNESNDENICILSNSEIVEKIKLMYSGKDILFLTQSNGRYVSSWLNIMRDDLACISFEARNNKREILYLPKDLSEFEMIKKISNREIGNKYLKIFYQLIENGELTKK